MSTNKGAPEKVAMARLASWFNAWKPFVKRTLRQSALQFPGCLSIYSLVVLILAALLYFSLRSSVFRENIWDWLEETSVKTFVVVVILFALYLIAVFILSLHPKTRKLASKLSIYLDEPEIEQLKERVGVIETKLALVEKRLDGLDKKTDRTNEILAEVQSTLNEVQSKLDEIEHRLGSIQDTLKTISNQWNAGSKDD
jgi:peptidoglycan hydrolase CwlO-like protein